MTCRCPMCGRKRAGRSGARAAAAHLIPRDEHGRSFVAASRKAERRLRRRREDRDWRLLVDVMGEVD